MIKSVKIENYKSIQELEVDVGRFNVIIGENGAGKSNFLEALVLFGAAEADKLDNEFLVSRGVRATLMVSQFTQNIDTINLYISNQDNKSRSISLIYTQDYYPHQLTIKHNLVPDLSILNNDIRENIRNIILQIPESIKEKFIFTPEEKEKLFNNMMIKLAKDAENINRDFYSIRQFILYSPENTALRNFYREGQIEPLGINGEGLLKLLKVMQESEPAAFQDVLTCLELFDWFEQIDVPKDLTSVEDKVTIKDKYLSVIFDQRSANEGFLFVLFYAALFCSQYTPKIFAIDNIDASFNPKLCTAIIKKLVELAKKYDKQAFVTTHNPAILDGIDLGDEEQKLFVASRNKQGHTRFKTLTLADKPKSSTGEPIRLSEAFLRGYLGGLPKNF